MSPVLIPFPKDIKREKSNAGNEQNETVGSNINEIRRFHMGTDNGSVCYYCHNSLYVILSVT